MRANAGNAGPWMNRDTGVLFSGTLPADRPQMSPTGRITALLNRRDVQMILLLVFALAFNREGDRVPSGNEWVYLLYLLQGLAPIVSVRGLDFPGDVRGARGVQPGGGFSDPCSCRYRSSPGPAGWPAGSPASPVFNGWRAGSTSRPGPGGWGFSCG